MSNNKQISSVEWYIARSKELKFMNDLRQITNQEFYEQLEQAKHTAKAMHKEEIIQASQAGFDDGNGFIEEMKYNSSSHYYNETFGGNK